MDFKHDKVFVRQAGSERVNGVYRYEYNNEWDLPEAQRAERRKDNWKHVWRHTSYLELVLKYDVHDRRLLICFEDDETDDYYYADAACPENPADVPWNELEWQVAVKNEPHAYFNGRGPAPVVSWEDAAAVQDEEPEAGGAGELVELDAADEAGMVTENVAVKEKISSSMAASISQRRIERAQGRTHTKNQRPVPSAGNKAGRSPLPGKWVLRGRGLGPVEVEEVASKDGNNITLTAQNLASRAKMEELAFTGTLRAESMVDLVKLDLGGCALLRALPESVGELESLQTLNLDGCSGLRSLPESMGRLVSLQTLSLDGCRGLSALADSLGLLLRSLEVLNLAYCEGLSALPDSVGELVSLQKLYLNGCRNLSAIPDSVGRLSALHTLYLPSCRSLSKLPGSLGQLRSLKFLYLDSCRRLATLPDSVCELASLEILNMDACEGLTELPKSVGWLGSLRILNLHSCHELSALPESVGELSCLQTLDLRFCKGLSALPESVGLLGALRTLDLQGCRTLDKLPDSLGKLGALQTLKLNNCEGLMGLPQSVGALGSLQTLDLQGCHGLSELPDSLAQLSSLQTLDVKFCTGLHTLPESVLCLDSLQNLDLDLAGSIRQERLDRQAQMEKVMAGEDVVIDTLRDSIELATTVGVQFSLGGAAAIDKANGKLAELEAT